MPTLPDLEGQARDFAHEVSELLNRTVTQGIRLTPVLQESTGTCWVARGLNKHDFSEWKSIPLSLGKQATGFLDVRFILKLDSEGQHLAVAKSHFGLYLDEAMEGMAFHYDFDRAPGNPYPQAHFQINGLCQELDDVPKESNLTDGTDITKDLKDYHFPVGGRRFRPSLEDVIEFLVVERIAHGRKDWELAVQDGRAKWEMPQLLAAVRRNPQAVRDYLADLPTDEDP